MKALIAFLVLVLGTSVFAGELKYYLCNFKCSVALGGISEGHACVKANSSAEASQLVRNRLSRNRALSCSAPTCSVTHSPEGCPPDNIN